MLQLTTHPTPFSRPFLTHPVKLKEPGRRYYVAKAYFSALGTNNKT